jgi:hypothetical protein
MAVIAWFAKTYSVYTHFFFVANLLAEIVAAYWLVGELVMQLGVV